MDKLVKDNASIGDRKKEMKQQFAKIISVLVSQPSYKGKLITGDITPKEMV